MAVHHGKQRARLEARIATELALLKDRLGLADDLVTRGPPELIGLRVRLVPVVEPANLPGTLQAYVSGSLLHDGQWREASPYGSMDLIEKLAGLRHVIVNGPDHGLGFLIQPK